MFNENRGTHMGVGSSSEGAAPPAHQHGQVQRESARAVTKIGAPRLGTKGRTHRQSLPFVFKCCTILYQVLNNYFPMLVLDPET